MKRLWTVRWLQDGKQHEKIVEALSAFGAVSQLCVTLWGNTQSVEAVSVWLDSVD